MGIDKDLAKLAQMGSAEDLRMLAAREALHLVISYATFGARRTKMVPSLTSCWSVPTASWRRTAGATASVC
jgi:hypothetical protein